MTAGLRPILVVGDSMLDRYWEGSVDRISPEAPVPVLRVTQQFSRAGGAANVALNIAALEGEVALLSLVGADEAGDTLAGLVRRAGVTLHAVGGQRHRTTQKIRCVAQRHQLLRTDFEEPATADCCAELRQVFDAVLPSNGIVVLSDYAKGALRDCPEFIDLAHRRGCLVLVDPKGANFRRYRGADVLKPNAAELRSVVGNWSGDDEFARRATRARRQLNLGALLVTRGELGMTLFDGDGRRDHPAQLREVYDVSGAGDTVIATLARFMAAGLPLDDCTRLANTAAGIAVSRFGTAAVALHELMAAAAPAQALPADARDTPKPLLPRTAAASVQRSAGRLQ